jgi:hypothetical protein
VPDPIRRIHWPFGVCAALRVGVPTLAAQHLVGRLDHALVDLVSALARDEIHHLGHDLDVRALEKALRESTDALLPGRCDDRRSARGGLGEERASGLQQARRIGERRELQLAYLDALRAPRLRHGHRAIGRDGDARRIGGNLNRGLDGIAIDRDETPLGVALQVAGARVAHRSIGALHLKEAFALDGEIERITTLLHRALLEDGRGRDGASPLADLQASRELTTTRGLPAWLAHRLIEQVLKFRAAAPESRGVHVRHVVGDDVDVQLLSSHPGSRGIERSEHDFDLLFSVRLPKRVCEFDAASDRIRETRPRISQRQRIG